MEATKEHAIQVDDVLSFRQFSKKAADDVIDVRPLSSLVRCSVADFMTTLSTVQYDQDVGRATGAAEVHEDFISNLSRISQLTGEFKYS